MPSDMMVMWVRIPPGLFMAGVVNIKSESFDEYIGRQEGDKHWGNPWSSKPSKFKVIRVASPERAVQLFDDWLDGKYPDVEPERRRWILVSLPRLKGKVLGCHCGKGKPCHGNVLSRRAEEIVED